MKDPLNFYEENGFVKIEGFFKSSEIENFKNEFVDFCKTRAKNLSGRHINYTKDGVVNSIHDLGQSEIFMNLLNGPRMRDFISPFLCSPARPRASEIFAKPAEVGLPVPVHQDMWYWCCDPTSFKSALTIWIPFEPVTEENGGIVYYQGSHLGEVIDHVPSHAPGSSQTIPEKILNALPYKKVLLPLQVGDFLVHDAMTIHESAPNRSSNPRTVLTLQYEGETVGVNEERKRKYEEQLNAQVDERKPT